MKCAVCDDCPIEGLPEGCEAISCPYGGPYSGYTEDYELQEKRAVVVAEGKIYGPFPSYEAASEWARGRFSNGGIGPYNPNLKNLIDPYGGSSNGKISDFESEVLGSTPSPPTKDN